MNKITILKRVVYKRDSNAKTSNSIPSKVMTPNITVPLNNDSKNINSKSSFFTNEAIIKSIINNVNTLPYNSFYPNIKTSSKRLVLWEDKQHKKTIKNKLLLTNNSSLNFNATKTYLSRFTNTYGSSDYKYNSLINLKDNNINFSKKNLNIDTNPEFNENIFSNVEKDINQNKKEMKLLKFKLNKILNENSLNICDTYQKKNENFNIKLKNYFNSEKYVKGKELEKENFNPNKKGFSSSHNLSNFYYEPQIDKKTNEELMACSLFNNLTNEERKIVCTNPKYFKIDKKKILIKKLNIVLDESLKDRIKREEKKLNENKIIPENEETKNELDSDIKKIFNKKLDNKLKIINEKKINNKIMQYHQKNKIKDMSRKKLIDYINSGINDYYKKFYSFCHKKYLKYNQFKESELYFRMFNHPLNYKMTREYQLTKNDQRLQKEGFFNLINKQKKAKTESLIKKIRSCQDMMKMNYTKNK